MATALSYHAHIQIRFYFYLFRINKALMYQTIQRILPNAISLFYQDSTG